MRRPMRRWLATGLAAAMLAACAGNGDDGDPAADEGGAAAGDQDAPSEDEDALSEGETGAWEPDQDVEFIIPFGPGGGFDAYSRQVVDAAQQFLPDGVSITVRNVEGAGGSVGAQTLLRAAPDGHTIGLVYDVGLAVSQTIDDQAEIDLLEDFAFIAGITEEPYTLFATADSGITSLEDLEGETVRYGALGAASPMFVAGVIAAELLGFDAQYVTAYPGAGDLLNGATRGDIDVSALEVSSIAQFVESGDFVPLLVLGEDPVDAFPDTPTIDAVEGLDAPILSLRPIGAPAGVDAAVVAYWEDVLLQAMATDEMQAWSEETGREVSATDAEAARVRVEGAIALMDGFRAQVQEEFAEVAA